MIVSYVPDPTSEAPYTALSKTGDRVFADGVPLLFGYFPYDPVFGEFIATRPDGRFRIGELREFLRAQHKDKTKE